MSCTDRAAQRRRRLVAAALALPLSLGMVGSAYASGPVNGPADESRGAAETASLRVASTGADKEQPAQAAAAQAAVAEKAELRVADAGPAEKAADKAAEKAAEKAAAPAKPAAEKAEKAADKPAEAAAPVHKPADKPTAPGAAAGAASGKSAAQSRDASSDPDKHGTPTSGPLSEEQPLSKADKNGTGANPGEKCTHSYCSTRDGSASGNGKGDGNATGKPCAGCVGKADNKNPKGQAPNGSDHNAGYECDRNQGIGKTNPAHTGCTGTTTPPTTPTTPDADACPGMPGKQKAGTTCETGGNNGGGGNGDACPGMPGKQKPGTVCETGGNNGGGGSEKITFCHATGSSTNPYVVITTSKAAAANGHHGADHQGGRDIVPAFTYQGVDYAAQGDQSLLGSGCVVPGSTVTDVCPNLQGNQPAGTTCPTGGTGGGGGSFDNCPDMQGDQPANTVCTVGSPTPTPPVKNPRTPISGNPPAQGATNPPPVGPPASVPPAAAPPVVVPAVIVPNSAVAPVAIGGSTVLPVDRPLSARAVPSALPFTGGQVAALVQLGLLLLIAGVGVGAVARRERTAA